MKYSIWAIAIELFSLNSFSAGNLYKLVLLFSGYCGYCPMQKYQLGETYGKTTAKLLTDDSVSILNKFLFYILTIYG